MAVLLVVLVVSTDVFHKCLICPDPVSPWILPDVMALPSYLSAVEMISANLDTWTYNSFGNFTVENNGSNVVLVRHSISSDEDPYLDKFSSFSTEKPFEIASSFYYEDETLEHVLANRSYLHSSFEIPILNLSRSNSSNNLDKSNHITDNFLSLQVSRLSTVKRKSTVQLFGTCIVIFVSMAFSLCGYDFVLPTESIKPAQRMILLIKKLAGTIFAMVCANTFQLHDYIISSSSGTKQ